MFLCVKCLWLIFADDGSGVLCIRTIVEL